MAKSLDKFSDNSGSNNLSASAFDEIQVSGKSPCPLSPERCESANDLERHELIHDNQVFSCDQCTLAPDLKFHKRSHTESDEVAQPSENTHICDKCNNSFKSSGELKCHMLTHKSDSHLYACEQCSDASQQTFHLKEFPKQSHSKFNGSACDKPHVCCECDKSFKSAVGLKRHLSIHDLQKRVHICDECSQSFTNAHHLKLHMRAHSEKIHRCESCAKVLASMRKLKAFLTDEEQRDLLCDLCSGGFGGVTNKRTTYVCSVCEKSFLSKTTLDRHFLLHTGERPFVCHVCNKSFNQKCTLDEHYLIHSPKNTFECRVCFRKFASKIYLKKHFRIHTDVDENYACDECSKKFTQKRYLAKHKRVVHMM